MPTLPSARDEASYGLGRLPPLSIIRLLARKYTVGNGTNRTQRLNHPFEKAGLQTFVDGFARMQAENPVVANQLEILAHIVALICDHDSRSVCVGDVMCGIRRMMVNDQDLGAGQKHLEGSPQPQGIIFCMQERRDWRHGAFLAP